MLKSIFFVRHVIFGRLQYVKIPIHIVSMFLTIQTSLLTGAILVLFLENKHLEQDTTDRFYERIMPFYHKFTLFVKLVQEFDFAYQYNQEVKNMICIATKQNIKNLSALAGRSILTGSDVQIMPSREIEQLCEDINNIWYTHDGYRSEYHSYVSFVNYNLQDHLKQIKEALIAYNPKYSDETITIDTLPKIAGDFYVEEWQPIQDVTSEYEFWQNKCQFFQKLSKYTIGYTVLTILVYILFPECEGSVFYNILLGISLYLFSWSLYDTYKLMELSKLVMR